MFVRLSGPGCGPGAAGHWTDAATAEFGDLLDVIRESCGFIDYRDVAEEARRFLALPKPERQQVSQDTRPARRGSPESARGLFAISCPLAGTLAEAYLHERSIVTVRHSGALRFHPRCYYRPDEYAPTEAWPAMVACITDLDGRITGVHRTWLDRSGRGKAPINTPRRAMGDLLGNAVRFGVADDVLAAGEGIETMLSLRFALPTMPMAAALSANHLAGLLLPPLRRLYIARDADAAGDRAVVTLSTRAKESGIEAITLSPRLGDFNDDLRAFGVDELVAALRHQLAPQDAQHFCDLMMAGMG